MVFDRLYQSLGTYKRICHQPCGGLFIQAIYQINISVLMFVGLPKLGLAGQDVFFIPLMILAESSQQGFSAVRLLGNVVVAPVALQDDFQCLIGT